MNISTIARGQNRLFPVFIDPLFISKNETFLQHLVLNFAYTGFLANRSLLALGN